ncbi:MAG TPA: hypothetical protein PKI14_14550 [Fervidobacterium sp.]|nr:hypothetical protein [Bacillota bacterium]HUM44159.1 hypothetical protein [Fervidobacterium sp.]
MNIWERLGNLDHRIYYVILIIVVGIPVLKPLGLPIKVGQPAQDFFDTVDRLPEGGKVLVFINYRTDCIVEMDPQLICIFKHVAQKNGKVIMVSGVDEGAMVSQAVASKVAEELELEYGVDWINLGYKPGGDVFMKKMVDDFWEACAYVDINGQPLDEFPIMHGFNSLAKADLVLNLVAVVPSPGERLLQMAIIPTKVPYAVGTTAIQATSEMVFYSSGQYQGLLAGLRGAAEYEFLLEEPGDAIAGMDSQSFAHILVIVLIVLGNLGYFLGEKKREG